MPPISHDISRDPLMLIRAADSGEIPIVCLPGAGASVTTFLDFTEALGERWPIYGLQPRGIDASERPHESVESAALASLLALARLTATGRIHLLGHSYGGVIAFEIARRLEQQRRDVVASLTVIDSDLSISGADSRHPDDPSMLREFVDGLEKTFRVSLRLSRPGIFAVSDTRHFLREVHAALVRAGSWPPSSTADMLAGPLATFVAACRCTYTPATRYGGTVALVLASDHADSRNGTGEQPGVSPDPWKRHAGVLDVWRCTGNHFSMLQAPHVHSLAAWWRKSRESAASKPDADGGAATRCL